MIPLHRAAFGFVAILLITQFTAACSARPSDSATETGRITNFTVCALPSTQGEGSFQGKWAALPIPTVIDRDFYLANQGEQATEIKAAITSWNNWAVLKGLTAFSLQNDGSGLGAGAGIPITDDCNQATITNARTDVVGIWKIQAGGDGRNTRDVNGSTCQLLETGVQGKTDWTIVNGTITGASILLNFDGFNSPGESSLDTQSLALHELGHVLGLLHSCNPGEGDTTTSIPCTEAPNRFLEAVMFPFLQISQIRRTILQNDYSRINCLY